MGKKLSDKTSLAIFGGMLVLLAVVLVIIFLMHGQTTVSGEYPGTVSSQSLDCKKDGFDYDLYRYNAYESQNVAIQMVFSGENDTLGAVALHITSTYRNDEIAEYAYARNRSAMDSDFSQSGYNPGAFSATYKVQGSQLLFSIHSNVRSITEKSRKYFLLDETENLRTLEEYKNYFEKNNFNCSIK